MEQSEKITACVSMNMAVDSDLYCSIAMARGFFKAGGRIINDVRKTI